ncbi:MAG: leucine-rich repeat domain-containing protein [Candidatus Muirbacterium halophilum]|nr:leucine-rich repeat domain-containing protein [Candidatus Muirbacterium halophilum]
MKENDNRYEIRCSIDNIIYSEPRTYITGWGKYFDNIFESAPDILDTDGKKSHILVTISPTIDLSGIQGDNYYVTSDGYSGVAKTHTFDTNYDISIYTQNGYIKRKVKYIIVYKVDNNEISSINVNKYIYMYINNGLIGAMYNSTPYSYIENVRFGSNVIFVDNSYFSFSSCCNLESIIIPNNLTQLNAFSECYSLKSIIIPSTINFLDSSCFKYCYSIESVNIPNTITNMDSYIFNGCYSLKGIVLPNNVINFYDTLVSCSNLKNVVIPTTAETLDGIFKYCTNLESVYIPDNVKSMASTFYGCYKLKNVNIPNYHLLELDYTFYNCYCLEKIHIPNNVTYKSHMNVFYSCYSLYDISIDNGRSESLVIEYLNQHNRSFILSLDSIINIIYNLGNVSGKTLTIGFDYVNMLPNEIKEIATNKGWILN